MRNESRIDKTGQLTPMVALLSALYKATRRSIFPSTAAYIMGKIVGDSNVTALTSSPYFETGLLFSARHMLAMTRSSYQILVAYRPILVLTQE